MTENETKFNRAECIERSLETAKNTGRIISPSVYSGLEARYMPEDLYLLPEGNVVARAYSTPSSKSAEHRTQSMIVGLLEHHRQSPLTSELLNQLLINCEEAQKQVGIRLLDSARNFEGLVKLTPVDTVVSMLPEKMRDHFKGDLASEGEYLLNRLPRQSWDISKTELDDFILIVKSDSSEKLFVVDIDQLHQKNPQSVKQQLSNYTTYARWEIAINRVLSNLALHESADLNEQLPKFYSLFSEDPTKLEDELLQVGKLFRYLDNLSDRTSRRVASFIEEQSQASLRLFGGDERQLEGALDHLDSCPSDLNSFAKSQRLKRIYRGIEGTTPQQLFNNRHRGDNVALDILNQPYLFADYVLNPQAMTEQQEIIRNNQFIRIIRAIRNMGDPMDLFFYLRTQQPELSTKLESFQEFLGQYIAYPDSNFDRLVQSLAKSWSFTANISLDDSLNNLREHFAQTFKNNQPLPITDHSFPGVSPDTRNRGLKATDLSLIDCIGLLAINRAVKDNLITQDNATKIYNKIIQEYHLDINSRQKRLDHFNGNKQLMSQLLENANISKSSFEQLLTMTTNRSLGKIDSLMILFNLFALRDQSEVFAKKYRVDLSRPLWDKLIPYLFKFITPDIWQEFKNIVTQNDQIELEVSA